MTAKTFWKVILPYHRKGIEFFVWGCIPFHPHEQGKALNPIRTPTDSELRQYSDILLDIVLIIKPLKIVAVGRKAERALSMVNVDSTYVRHPSRGGATDFKNGMKKLFGAENRRDLKGRLQSP